MMDKNSRRVEFQAIDPYSGKPDLVVWVPPAKVQVTAVINAGAIKTLAQIVPQVLLHPTAIFEGLTRETDEDKSDHSRGNGWLCFCGLPGKRFSADGNQIRAPMGKVYLVFVNSEKATYHWRWDDCDRKNNKLPEGFETRFRKKLI